MKQVIQYINKCKNNQEAQEILNIYKIQEGFIFGRIIKEKQVQIFFSDFDGLLPDNCKRVLLPDNLI